MTGLPSADLHKAELHLHIEGTLEPALAFELAGRNGVLLPYQDISALSGAYDFTDLSSFLALYYDCMAVLRTARDFEDLADAYLRKAHADGVVHVEMFFDPQAHIARGVALADVISGLTQAGQTAQERDGITVLLIACFLRDRGPREAMDALEALSPYTDQVIGVGLDSAEMGYPPSDFAAVFEAARGLGFRCVAHAGEEGPPSYVWEALDVLGVERVDHGIRCLEDDALVPTGRRQGPADGLPAVQRTAALRRHHGRPPVAPDARRRPRRDDQLRRPGLLRRLRRRQLPRGARGLRVLAGRPGRSGPGLARRGVPDMTSWALGEWLNPPVAVAADGDDLLVTAAGGSDLWQGTYYGFHRDNGHALLAPFAEGSAVEVSFVVDYQSLYDQAGLLVRVDETTWVKTGVEISDGIPQLSAVVTHGDSDWSTAPVPEWAGATVTLRASWDRQALILRARVGDGPWRMLRLAAFPATDRATAGPYCCAPERDGLTVRFTGWRVTVADAGLHL